MLSIEIFGWIKLRDIQDSQIHSGSKEKFPKSLTHNRLKRDIQKISIHS